MEGLTVIDARAAARSETGGVERWARELASRLPLMRPGSYRAEAPSARFTHRLGHVWEQLVLPVAARRQHASLLLCPANLAPLASRINVIVIHDVAPLRYPGDFSKAYASWQRFLLPRLAAGAVRVIVPSEFSKSELLSFCDLPEERIEVVAPGVPDNVLALGAGGGGQTAGVGRNPNPSGRPYVLTVASQVRRKNLEALVPVAEALAEEGVDLIAAGGTRPQFADTAAGGRVVGLGPVRESELPALYAGAMAFVLPSRYEGFGLPVCEAMAAGVPVVTTTAASLPEAAGGAALLVDPDDRPGLVNAVCSAAFDGGLRADLIAKGLERTSRLDWHGTAEAVDRVIQAALRA